MFTRPYTPAILSDEELNDMRVVPGDSRCDDLLDRLLTLSGDKWRVKVSRIQLKPRWYAPWWKREVKMYRLYELLPMEGWVMLNLDLEQGKDVESEWWMEIRNQRRHSESRTAVVNYMRGMIDVLGERDLMRPKVADVCTHDWVDARNSKVSSGEYCAKCGEIRATVVFPDVRKHGYGQEPDKTEEN